MNRSFGFRNANRRALTLIEMLIVVAMLSVLSGAFFTVVHHTIVSEAEDNVRSMLRQEGLSVVRSFIRDTHLGQCEKTLASVGVVGIPADIRADSQTVILQFPSAHPGTTRPLVYRRNGARLERMVWSDAATTPVVQTLTTHVRVWAIERSDGLARVRIELAASQYAKEFTTKYAFETRMMNKRN